MSQINKMSSLLSLAVIVALSACGKSKDLSTPPAAKSPAPTVSTPAPESSTTKENPQSLPGNQVPGTGNMLPAQNNEGYDNNVHPPLPVGNGDNSGTDNSSVIRPPLVDSSANQGSAASRVNFENQIAVKTGGRTNDLFYTSAGADGLMNEFKANSLKVSADQQRMNMNLAKAVVTAKLSRSNSSGEVLVELNIDESINGTGAVKVYRLKATADAAKMNLSLASSSGGLNFQGGFLKCLDQDGGCENAYAKIKLSGAYTRIIFRNSYADRHFSIQENVVNNSAFDLMKRYVLNTVGNVNTTERIAKLQISSFEVTNGRAGMGALLTTQDNEMIGLSIPLVVSGDKSDVTAEVTKLSDLSRNYDLSNLANSFSERLSKNISDVKLVKNNGLGQVKLKMNFISGADSAAIWMIISRVQKPELSIEQVRLFESEVKNF